MLFLNVNEKININSDNQNAYSIFTSKIGTLIISTEGQPRTSLVYSSQRSLLLFFVHLVVIFARDRSGGTFIDTPDDN